MNKNEARIALEAAGISREDPFIIAFRSPRMWGKAVAFLAACYGVLLLIRAVVC